MRLKTFYQEINKEWLKRHVIPSDNDSASVFDQLEESVREGAIRCIKAERLRSTPFGAFIESIYTGRGNDLTFITDLINRECDSWTTMTDCFRTIGYFNTFMIRTPLAIDASFDIHNNWHYNLNLSEPNLGILKEEYTDKSETYKEYKGFIKRFFDLRQERGAGKFVEIEEAIAAVAIDPRNADSPETVYNPHSLDLLKTRYPDIGFETLLKSYGIGQDLINSTTYVVTNPKFLELLNNWVTSKSLADWRFMVKSMALISLTGILPEPYESLHFDFFHKYLNGQTKPYTADRKAFIICDDVCTDLLGKLYVEANRDEFQVIRRDAAALCRTVLNAAKHRVMKLNWMSDGSKAIACDKMAKMNLKIAYPDAWENELEGILVDKECFLMNLFMARKLGTLVNIRRLVNVDSVDRKRWHNGCYDVNAYYYTETNELCIPLGFLQPPFFSLKASYMKNLAGLGNIVGHEISHGFDEEGHKYDSKGNFYPWWTSIDVELYTNKTRQLVDAYNRESYYGLKIDGELTLGENLADFGAVAIGIDIIRARGNHKEDFREYFIEYAKTWASKERAAKRERDVKSDPHPPAQLRVNTVLKHFDDFYTAFDFTEEEPGAVPVTERIDVWGR